MKLKYFIEFTESIEDIQSIEPDELSKIQREIKNVLYQYLTHSGLQIEGNINLEFDFEVWLYMNINDIAVVKKGFHSLNVNEEVVFIGIDYGELGDETIYLFRCIDGKTHSLIEEEFEMKGSSNE